MTVSNPPSPQEGTTPNSQGGATRQAFPRFLAYYFNYQKSELEIFFQNFFWIEEIGFIKNYRLMVSLLDIPDYVDPQNPVTKCLYQHHVIPADVDPPDKIKGSVSGAY
jgi:hypothetical protein